MPNIPLSTILVLDAYVRSDLVGQGIILVQLLLSFFVVKQILSRYRRLKDIETANARFAKLIRDAPENVLAPYLQRKVDALDSPLAKIYRVCCDRVVSLLAPEVRNSTISAATPDDRVAMSVRETDLVARTAEHTLAEQCCDLQQGLRSIAVVATVAPMFGLFGTVWGIMVAFNAMASKGSALLSELAPGISSALLTTVVGLFVAIPASCAHAFLVERAKRIRVDCEGFTDELMGRIANELQGRGE